MDCRKKETARQGSGVTLRPVPGVTHRPRGAEKEDNKTPVASVLPHSPGDDIPAGPSVLVMCRAGPGHAHQQQGHLCFILPLHFLQGSIKQDSLSMVDGTSSFKPHQWKLRRMRDQKKPSKIRTESAEIGCLRTLLSLLKLAV